MKLTTYISMRLLFIFLYGWPVKHILPVSSWNLSIMRPTPFARTLTPLPWNLLLKIFQLIRALISVDNISLWSFSFWSLSHMVLCILYTQSFPFLLIYQFNPASGQWKQFHPSSTHLGDDETVSGTNLTVFWTSCCAGNCQLLRWGFSAGFESSPACMSLGLQLLGEEEGDISRSCEQYAASINLHTVLLWSVALVPLYDGDV